MRTARVAGHGADAKRERWIVLGVLAAIVLGAIALRFVDLAANPGGLYPDEAAEGLDARRILHDPAAVAVFLPSDGGREATFAYLVAGAFALFGQTTTVLRGTAAAVGVLGVVAIWSLARRFGTIAGLAGAAWAAGSLWLVCVSRDGMRNGLVPLFGAAALLALIEWQARPTRRSAIVAGALTAFAALYTYQPLKLLPVLVVVWLWVGRRADRAWFGRLRPGLISFGVAFAIVALPMAVAAATNPANYFGRAAAVSPFNPEAQSDSDLVGHLLRTLGMFAITGDPNGRHDVDALPLLGWPLAVVALAGLVRLWRGRSDPANALVLIALGGFILPPLVATEGSSPHFLRSLGLAAPLAVAIGLGSVEIVELLGRRLGNRAAMVGLLAGAAAFVVLGVGSGVAYLARPTSERTGPFSYDLVALARAADSSRTVAIVDDYGAMTVEFLDAASMPSLVAPGAPIANATSFDRIVALRFDDLGAAVGSALAARAVEEHPLGPGTPSVWSVTP